MPILALKEEQGLIQLMKVDTYGHYGHFSSCSNSENLYATTASKLNDSFVNI